MENLHVSLSEAVDRVGVALKGKKGSELAASFRQLLAEVSNQVTLHPLESLSTAMVLGFVLAKTLESQKKSTGRRILGKALGFFAAVAFTEYATKKRPKSLKPTKIEKVVLRH